jgi:hypothetical protein
MADFSFVRLPAVDAVGQVTFSRYNSGITATVPVGTIVRATQGTQIFAVVADPTNSAWNNAGAYTLPSGVGSIGVPIAATQPGNVGNVQSGAIGLLASPIPGIDVVTNLTPTSGGLDPETDLAFCARFQLYINSRSLATKLAVLTAIAGLQQGLRYAVLENQTIGGLPQAGNFCAIVDDGSGSPPAALLSAAQSAVDAVRPIGSTFTVNGPVVMVAAVNVVLLTSNPITLASVAAAVQQNILPWIASLPVAGILALSKIEAIAHATDASVISVTSALINNEPSDLLAPDNGVIIAGPVTVS